MEYGDILYGDVKNALYITHVVHDIDICGEKYDIEYIDYSKTKRKITVFKDREKIKEIETIPKEKRIIKYYDFKNRIKFRFFLKSGNLNYICKYGENEMLENFDGEPSIQFFYDCKERIVKSESYYLDNKCINKDTYDLIINGVNNGSIIKKINRYKDISKLEMIKYVAEYKNKQEIIDACNIRLVYLKLKNKGRINGFNKSI